MSDSDLISRTAAYVRQTLAADSSHDWFHVERVWRNSQAIGQEEGADLTVVELAALLHDIADWKFHGGDEAIGPRMAREWMASQHVPAETIEHVCDIIAKLSFKGAGVKTDMPSLEGAIVQDADRLDAIGAIGVARAFSYGGHAGRAIYKNNKGPTINHFYEKLLLLKDRMNTRTGRRLAAQRHEFMEQFLAQFFAEWGVEQESAK
jgi:uncharacterized protein